MYLQKSRFVTGSVLFITMFFTIFAIVIFAHPSRQNSGAQPNLSSTPEIGSDSHQNPRLDFPAQKLKPLPTFASIQPDIKVSTVGPGPSVTPPRISISLTSGQSSQSQINVFTGDAPIGKGDIIFVFDRTSSMKDEIDQAKLSAVQIMKDIRAKLPFAWFGVGSFMDYPNFYTYPGYADRYGDSAAGDLPWELNINPTDNITDVAAAINKLSLGYGKDWPEDYTRALYEVSRVDSVGWRAGAKKIVVFFGDAPTHDLNFAGYNFGGDPGPDNVAQTSDDLDFESIVQQLANKEISVIAVNSDSNHYAESTATMKGMSIGHAAAVGTRGQYFELNNASQIPTAVVNLVTAATQKINRLSLQVTPGYESWIKITPAEYLSVASNTTKTFDVVITVPAGTLSGFYPLVVQAIGDGALLGVTFVDVTIPASSPISDLGFRPNRDGFLVQNESSNQTWDMFKTFFGTDKVQYSNGNRIHAADVYYRENYQKAGNGGSCDGFAAVSLLNYINQEQPNAGVYAMSHYTTLYAQIKNPDLTDAWSFSQGVQTGLEVGAYRQYLCQRLNNSPGAMYRFLKSQIQNNRPVVVSFWWDKDYYAYFPKELVLKKEQGHSVAAYKLEEPSSDKAYVYVYDSNLPGNDEHRIEFDLVKDKWTYKWPVPLWPDITIEGDTAKCNLQITPIELYRHPGLAWWTQSGSEAVSSILDETAPEQVFATSGLARLLFTDDQGRRLGWEGDSFYDEIPGANYIPNLNAVDSNESGMYLISSDVKYDLKLYGSGQGQADVDIWSKGYMLQLSDLKVATGAVASVNVPPDGKSISVSGLNYNFQGALSVNSLLTNEDRAVTIGSLEMHSGVETTLQFTASNTVGFVDEIKLSTTDSAAQTYSLSLQRASGSGYSAFGNGSLVLDSNSASLVKIPDWSNLNQVTVLIDQNRDGTIDESRLSKNAVIVSSVDLEAEHSSVQTGGESVDIIVAVKDQFGAYAPDGTFVNLSTTLGKLSIGQGNTSGGLVHVSLTSAVTAGNATISAKAGDSVGTLQVEFVSSASTPGDCNGDHTVGASDITALAQEFFDGDDNNNPAATSGGTYPGNPGCDANQDKHIGASDVTCIAQIFFNGAGACHANTNAATSVNPVLSMPHQLPAAPGGKLTVPIVLQANNSAANSLLFSLDYDEKWLSFDPADNNHDGIPDAITFTLPQPFLNSVTFDKNDTDGELDFAIAGFSSPPAALKDGILLSVTFGVGHPPDSTEAAIQFSQQPAASFGDTQGQELAGITVSGSVLIASQPDASTIYLPLIVADH